jgi:hypothetical protein
MKLLIAVAIAISYYYMLVYIGYIRSLCSQISKMRDDEPFIGLTRQYSTTLSILFLLTGCFVNLRRRKDEGAEETWTR